MEYDSSQMALSYFFSEFPKFQIHFRIIYNLCSVNNEQVPFTTVQRDTEIFYN